MKLKLNKQTLSTIILEETGSLSMSDGPLQMEVPFQLKHHARVSNSRSHNRYTNVDASRCSTNIHISENTDKTYFHAKNQQTYYKGLKKRIEKTQFTREQYQSFNYKTQA